MDTYRWELSFEGENGAFGVGLSVDDTNIDVVRVCRGFHLFGLTRVTNA